MNPREDLTRLTGKLRALAEQHRLVLLVILAGLVLLLLPAGEETPQPEPQQTQNQFDLSALERWGFAKCISVKATIKIKDDVLKIYQKMVY